MASFQTRDLERCFTGKLRARVVQGSHRKYTFYDDEGAYVAQTMLSHGFRPSETLSGKLIQSICRQLKLQGHPASCDDLIRCPLSRQAWLDLVQPSAE